MILVVDAKGVNWALLNWSSERGILLDPFIELHRTARSNSNSIVIIGIHKRGNSFAKDDDRSCLTRLVATSSTGVVSGCGMRQNESTGHQRNCVTYHAFSFYSLKFFE
jgi:hypothetical protein